MTMTDPFQPIKSAHLLQGVRERGGVFVSVARPSAPLHGCMVLVRVTRSNLTREVEIERLFG